MGSQQSSAQSQEKTLANVVVPYQKMQAQLKSRYNRELNRTALANLKDLKKEGMLLKGLHYNFDPESMSVTLSYDPDIYSDPQAAFYDSFHQGALAKQLYEELQKMAAVAVSQAQVASDAGYTPFQMQQKVEQALNQVKTQFPLAVEQKVKQEAMNKAIQNVNLGATPEQNVVDTLNAIQIKQDQNINKMPMKTQKAVALQPLAPGQPVVGAPGQPKNQAQGQPKNRAQGQPQAGAPGQPVVGAQGQPQVGAPGQPQPQPAPSLAIVNQKQQLLEEKVDQLPSVSSVQNVSPDVNAPSDVMESYIKQQVRAQGQPQVRAQGQTQVRAQGQPQIRAQGQPQIRAQGQPQVRAQGFVSQAPSLAILNQKQQNLEQMVNQISPSDVSPSSEAMVPPSIQNAPSASPDVEAPSDVMESYLAQQMNAPAQARPQAQGVQKQQPVTLIGQTRPQAQGVQKQRKQQSSAQSLMQPSSVMDRIINSQIKQGLQKPLEVPLSAVSEVPLSDVSQISSAEVPSSQISSAQVPSSQRSALTPRS